MDRKYRMTHLGEGDYLLPANDGATFWRIMRYEDGPSHGLMDWPRDRMLWGAWCWRGTEEELLALDMDSDDWSPWSTRWMMTGTFDTRREAVDAALEETAKKNAAATLEARGGLGIGSVLAQT